MNKQQKRDIGTQNWPPVIIQLISNVCYFFMTSIKNISTQILQSNIENSCKTPTSPDRVRHLSDVLKVYGFRLFGFSCGTIFFSRKLDWKIPFTDDIGVYFVHFCSC